jgi:hypothetical protein
MPSLIIGQEMGAVTALQGRTASAADKSRVVPFSVHKKNGLFSPLFPYPELVEHLTGKGIGLPVVAGL